MRALGQLVVAALAGALLIALLSQLPARHPVDVGGWDAAYVQGFAEAERADDPGGPAPYLAGSDGAARWTGASSAIRFPQAGLPGTVSLRLRGWRADGPPPQVSVLLNGVTPLGQFQTTGDWEEWRFPVDSGLLKASDIFVEIRAETTELPDGRAVGALIDQATYEVALGPNTPFPAQIAYGGAVAALLWMLVGAAGGGATLGGFQNLPGFPATRRFGAALLLYGLLWLLLYRWPPPLYPYPIRPLPWLVIAALGAALLLRDGPALAARHPALLRVAAPVGVIAAWLVATLAYAQDHLTLARPGVENDFRVFATRETIGQVFSADGFYNLGYPLLLYLARPLVDGNAFLAGRALAALSGAALLGAGYWLARSLMPPGPALLALIGLALSGFVAQYGLYVGSDMPFAACVALSVAALVAALRRWERGGAGDAFASRRVFSAPLRAFRGPGAWIALAGLLAGCAFLMRHLGLILLPWGLIVLLIAGRHRGEPRLSPVAFPLLPLAVYLAAFLLAAAPQLVVNSAQAGQPLYNQQAKNIWLAVYGGTDWGRWDEAPNSIGLAEVVLRDPARFLGNWWRNLIAYVGAGAEDTSEFGRAIQLRLLGWPANWLALAGLAWWLLKGAGGQGGRGAGGHAGGGLHVPPAPFSASGPLFSERPPQRAQRAAPSASAASGPLLALIALYVAAVATAFVLPRFFLPLAPIYAAAAGWAAWRVAGGGRRLLGVGLALVVVLWGGYGAGAGYVLAGQPPDEVAAIRMVLASTPPDAPIAARVAGRLPIAKYSAIAHRAVDWPEGADLQAPVAAADLERLRAAGARYLLWDEAAGPPPLPDPAAALVAAAGRYALYRL